MTTYTLNVFGWAQVDPGYIPGRLAIITKYDLADPAWQNFNTEYSNDVGVLTATTNTSVTPKEFATVKECIDYFSATGISSVIGNAQAINSSVAFGSLVYSADNGKQSIVTGKGLSTEDYSTAEKSKLAGLSLVSQQSHIADGTAGATTNLPTNFNTLSGLLGIAAGLNDANTAQNDMATKYNALVVKFNSVLDALEANGILHN